MRETPNFDFGLPEGAQIIREAVEHFAVKEIAPLAAKIDAEDWFPRDELWPAMGELGLHGITVSEEDGGLGLGYLSQRRQGCRQHCTKWKTRPECRNFQFRLTSHLRRSQKRSRSEWKPIERLGDSYPQDPCRCSLH